MCASRRSWAKKLPLLLLDAAHVSRRAACGQFHLKYHRGILLSGSCWALSPHKNLNSGSPCVHILNLTWALSPTAFFVVGPVGSDRSWSVLERCTQWCCSTARPGETDKGGERITSVWSSEFNMQISKYIETNFPVIHSVLFKQRAH